MFDGIEFFMWYFNILLFYNVKKHKAFNKNNIFYRFSGCFKTDLVDQVGNSQLLLLVLIRFFFTLQRWLYNLYKIRGGYMSPRLMIFIFLGRAFFQYHSLRNVIPKKTTDPYAEVVPPMSYILLSPWYSVHVLSFSLLPGG